MTIDGFSVFMCGAYLTHHLWVVVKYACEVHHLTQHADVVTSHQLFHPSGINHGTAGLDVRRIARHATGRGKAEVERSIAP